jgi:hypothetical protein
MLLTELQCVEMIREIDVDTVIESFSQSILYDEVIMKSGNVDVSSEWDASACCDSNSLDWFVTIRAYSVRV